ncbi:MAG TPA: nicotinate phosphoribosyltransferase, partial [Flavisolibacter sp.]|nr:nicotinate phosphoribosyltransferase [Flavisolibacter sp.]
MVQLESILDNDFYKFTMQQGVVKLFPRAKSRYNFINRGDHAFPEGFGEELKRSVFKLSELGLTIIEKEWLSQNCPYLDPVYLDFLQGYKYDPDEVTIHQKGNKLFISIEGFWYRTILWEVPLLALISELYYKTNNLLPDTEAAIVDRTSVKMNGFSELGIKIADFGTRRRFSFSNHKLVIETMKKFPETFVGTSNVYLAFKYNTRPIGTHAHEWFMFHAAKYGFKIANAMALENWVNVYRGDLGIALSDTFTTDEFYEIFDKKFAKLFDGVRQDSGDPIEFAKKTISHYEHLGIDPTSKTIIFSNAL